MSESATPRVAITGLPTGVPGLDEVLGGGLPEYSLTLIAGAPGTGKTTLAHQLVTAHGGRLEAQSTEGVGTTFTVWLPLLDATGAP